MESDKEMIHIDNTDNTNAHPNQVMNDGIELDMVTEGKATVRLSNDDKSFSAFYNPAQVRITFINIKYLN